MFFMPSAIVDANLRFRLRCIAFPVRNFPRQFYFRDSASTLAANRDYFKVEESGIEDHIYR